MKFIETPIKSAYVLKPEPIEDHRGRFCRIFCEEELKKIGLNKKIVQMNHSITLKKGTIRGLHFQKPPKSEIKIVKCVKGSVFDVIVDLRRNSSTLFQWYGTILSSYNIMQMYVPIGMAHGFQTIEDNSELIYFHTEYYSSEHERGLRYNDPEINIKWPLRVKDISEKDINFPFISNSLKWDFF